MAAHKCLERLPSSAAALTGRQEPGRIHLRRASRDGGFESRTVKWRAVVDKSANTYMIEIAAQAASLAHLLGNEIKAGEQ
jgi:hypothetical protein